MAEVTPASVFKKRGTKEAEAYKRDLIRVKAEGHIEGRAEARSQMVDFLHKKYLDPKLERGTPEAKAILEVARELSNFLNGTDLPKSKGGKRG